MPTFSRLLYQRLRKILYRLTDKLFLPLDREYIQRTKNISLIPKESFRRGGKYAYGEWAHVIGIFQTLINQVLDGKSEKRILDIGCGTGLLGIACMPFLGHKGKYTGIDVIPGDIEFCRNHFPPEKFEFIHLDVSNPYYAPSQQNVQTPWPLENSSFDLVTALSVWTHFSEADAMFYMSEVARILKPGAKAIITFFRLDEYTNNREGYGASKFHNTDQDLWIFDQPAYNSKDWSSPGWVSSPETAVGVNNMGFNRLLDQSGLIMNEYYPGNWKEIPGIYFQDIVILKKPNRA